MRMTVKANYLAREAIAGKKDPSKTYYNATFIQGSEPIQLSATAEAYAQLADYNQLEETTLNLDYNNTYKTLRLMSVGVQV